MPETMLATIAILKFTKRVDDLFKPNGDVNSIFELKFSNLPNSIYFTDQWNIWRNPVVRGIMRVRNTHHALPDMEHAHHTALTRCGAHFPATFRA